MAGLRAAGGLARALACAAVASASLTAAAAGSTFVAPPRVTVIGDSVLTAVLWQQDALAVLQQGFDMQLDIGVCRRLTGVSCPFLQDEVPTLEQVVSRMGSQIAPTVIVEVGYNDPSETFPENVEGAITALLRAGARRILWVNLREQQGQFALMNRALNEAAARHREVTIVDWNLVSHERWSWFQSDGIHLGYDGALAMATLLHTELSKALAPPLVAVTPRLPVGSPGTPYSARLVAAGGTPPYRWKSVSGPLPRGLRLLVDGRITGTPARADNTPLRLVAADVHGQTVEVRVTILVERS